MPSVGARSIRTSAFVVFRLRAWGTMHVRRCRQIRPKLVDDGLCFASIGRIWARNGQGWTNTFRLYPNWSPNGPHRTEMAKFVHSLVLAPGAFVSVIVCGICFFSAAMFVGARVVWRAESPIISRAGLVNIFLAPRRPKALPTRGATMRAFLAFSALGRGHAFGLPTPPLSPSCQAGP